MADSLCTYWTFITLFIDMSRILSPEEWIKKVQGNAMLDSLYEEGANADWVLMYMKWYGEYVERKTKENDKRV
jgi:hypothetical protein